ncbi:MAG: putative phage tail protein [Nitrosomonadaceae bacterium]
MSDLITRHTKTEMISSLAAYLPGGELFEAAFIPGTNFNALLAGLSGELLRAENFMFLYNSQFIPDDTTVFIEEWESALAIPDDCFIIDESDTNEQRRLNILVKLASLGVQTVDDFENLAAILGFADVQVLPGVGSDDESILNGSFDTGASWTLGTGWTISGGTANKASGVASDLEQDITSVTGELYVVGYEISNRTAGSVTADVGGTDGDTNSENGTFEELIVGGSSDTDFRIQADANFDGSIDNVSVRGSEDTDPRFTIVVIFPSSEAVEKFALDFPIPFGNPVFGILVCLFTKLKPANCDIIFKNST